MSWKDKIENGVFKITTGDGKVFKPLYRPGRVSKDYNTTSYNFIGREGTLVDRKKPQSGKYPLSFWFQGEDHVEETEAFMKSADDPRAWEVQHPLYGNINGQPINIEKNDSNLGLTEITVEFWESISVDYPDEEISVRDQIYAQASNVKAAGVKSFSSATPDTGNISIMKQGVTSTRGSFIDLATEQSVAFENAYTTAIKAADKLLSAQDSAIRAQHSVISLPAQFTTPVQRRISAFEDAIGKIPKEDKYYYESQAAAGIASACECAVTGEYITRTEIELVVEVISGVYDEYLKILDENKVGFYEIEKTWNADPVLQQELKSLMTYTVANLQVLAFEALQERTVYTDKESNLIVLCHRYMGVPTDENLERFRKINNIKNEELFKVNKDRKIKYFA